MVKDQIKIKLIDINIYEAWEGPNMTLGPTYSEGQLLLEQGIFGDNFWSDSMCQFNLIWFELDLIWSVKKKMIGLDSDRMSIKSDSDKIQIILVI